ncbi:integral membrane protein (TIGR00529 family) [Clostridium punense]|uniref:Integral membrane protein (TIGR00529 family) n=1 Tax=Clostridium punense TaxID=1054297 RepID=A0ABS4K5C7_9CLOT|nr:MULTISPECIES: DUF401 family protein [Clostridium]EQB89552.1 hypothetical protein M918_20170 [Clostridium sp. BL8]MBP2022968.1 integral membrane protein (TIGR00529 family) [Clostridium punense]
MDIIKLILIFSCIVMVIKLKKPLYVSISAGILGTILLYGINPVQSIKLIKDGAFSLATLNLILAFYTITFLQRMMEKRDHLMLAEKSLSNLFNNRRVNAMIAPFIIGLLPSPGAVLIASPIVDNAGENYISIEEKTFITSYFRHISEAFLPTYSTILLALNLSGVDMTAFVIAMLPMVVVLFLLGYFMYVKKIPKDIEVKNTNNKRQDLKNLIISLWPIVFTIVIILMLKIPVHYAVFPIIILSFFLNKFSFEEIKPMFASAVESKLILTTIVIMVFKEVLTFTGVIQRLPEYFSALPIPPVIIFMLLFFFGTLVAGAQGMIAIAVPLAYATIPNGGLALMVLIMCTTYIAMQISPTHICLAIVVEHYGTSFIDLVKKTIPILLSFIVISSLYSYLLYFLL